MSRTPSILVSVILASTAFHTTSYAQSSLQLAPFNSIEVRDGGHVTVRAAATQRVRIIKGSLNYSRISVTRSGNLIIDRCESHCPKGYELEVEVSAPRLGSMSVANSGRLETRGDFPLHGELDIEVSHGGMVDARAIAAENVNATVNQGGEIFTSPRETLSASVTQGGIITYWGNPRVRSSVEHGGAVTKGQN